MVDEVIPPTKSGKRKKKRNLIASLLSILVVTIFSVAQKQGYIPVIHGVPDDTISFQAQGN